MHPPSVLSTGHFNFIKLCFIGLANPESMMLLIDFLSRVSSRAFTLRLTQTHPRCTSCSYKQFIPMCHSYLGNLQLFHLAEVSLLVTDNPRKKLQLNLQLPVSYVWPLAPVNICVCVYLFSVLPE